MVRKTLHLFVHCVTWVKRRQRVRTDTGPVKVNLGAGLCVAPGWMHVDGGVYAMCSTWPTSVLRWVYRNSDARNSHSEEDYLRILRQHRFVHHGLEYGVPYGDGTVDFIYSSHMLEHLFKNDAAWLLRDAYRVLKSGGRIRIAIPDLEYALTLYRQGAKEQALEFFFSDSRAGYLNQHHYMYDFELLSRLLATAGFVGIERCVFRKGEVPDLEILDNRPEESLFVEARK